MPTDTNGFNRFGQFMAATRGVLAVALLSSCFTKQRPALDPNTVGGSLSIPSCGYTVTTRDQSTAPKESTPFAGSDPTPFAIHLTTPADPSKTMAVLWRTKDNETLSTVVEYGEGDNLNQRIDGFTFYYKTIDQTDFISDINIRMHEAHLCGLKPNTAYSYRVGSVVDSNRVFSPTYKFRTAPVAGEDSEIQLLVIGDCRQGYDNWRRALDQVNTLGRPDIILFNGDAVEFGSLQVEWDKWFAASTDFFTSIPLVYAHGNHDNNFVNYYSQFAFPGDEENFGLDYGPFHLTVLNDSPVNFPQDNLTRVPQALQTDLAAHRNAGWKLVMHHRPLYSAAKSGHPPDTDVVRAWTPILDQYHVDLDFSGHDHNYERTKPIRNRLAVPLNSDNTTDGVVYAVLGTSGASLYENGSDPVSTQISESTMNFALVRVRRGQLEYKAYRLDGSVIDQFKLTKAVSQP